MDWRLRIPGATYRRAVEKAGSDAELAALVRGWIERYLAPPQAAGGHASAASLSADARRARAQRAARTRWAQRDHDPDA